MDKYIDNEIWNIRYKYDYGSNLNSLLYLYTEMTDKNEEIEIIYKPIKEEEEEENEDKKEKIRIFGKYFVNINYQKCKIIYKDREYELHPLNIALILEILLIPFNFILISLLKSSSISLKYSVNSYSSLLYIILHFW